MPYCTASAVSAYSKNILGPNKIFTDSTCPTIDQVNSWMSSGCSIIETALLSERYTVPVASTAGVYGWIAELNAMYTASHVEFYRTNVTVSPGERTRAQIIYEMFKDELKALLYGWDGKGNDLTLVGISRTSVGPIYAGGLKKSDKQVWESDADRTTPFFFRGMGRFPGTIDPAAGTAS